jgi:hypothetical protein
VKKMSMDEQRKAGEEFAREFAKKQQGGGGQHTPPASATN